jgi:hypothetical protein
VQTKTFIVVCAIVGVSAATSACSTGNLASEGPSSQPNASPTSQATVALSPSLNPSIRAIDFANFAYPAKPEFSYGRNGFKLAHGKYAGDKTHDPLLLASVGYGDVTGDGREEAMVILGVSLRGSAIPHIVYIYTAQGESQKLLWAFETGDRGDGGLRQAYAESGQLVVELYGKNKLTGKNLYQSDPFTLEGACCPKFFTRARYRWQDDHFQQEEKEEVLPNPEGHGSLVMARYHP